MNGEPDGQEFKMPVNKSKKSAKDGDKSTRKKRKRKWKDPDAPKRPLGAYFYYFKANNERVKQEHPEFIQKQVVAKIAADWKKLTAEQKEPFAAKSTQDKQRYIREKALYDERKKKEEEEAGNEEDKCNNNKRPKGSAHSGYDKNGIKRAKHEITFDVKDEKEVRLKDLLNEDLSFASDSEELAEWSPPGSAEGQRPRIFNKAPDNTPDQVMEKPNEVQHQRLMIPPIMDNKINEQQPGKIFFVIMYHFTQFIFQTIHTIALVSSVSLLW